ncbi:CotS family spore coat protein [Clostridium neonatale]|uniref:CotS family spore coat protein n=1 Tax=Clostridium neonatale TaxID=137838 RepID=UPI00291C0878|nr:putative spore coat protein [Clostridium neonatale]CAI3595084.1 putative spore coat protein [Clostridium neonatale]CAI3616830.1 putative spore coat protein [Clostridium neonatale]CAI3618243.1 putative spore coat protein [Clostridium neonatale]CAI3621613.1 putative spore coat protein [Clostridium neonatale]
MNNEVPPSSNYNLSPEIIKQKVLPFYNLKNAKVSMVKFKDSDKQRAVYKITNDEKNYCLKKVYYNKNDLLYVYSAIEWLYQNNINVPKLLPTVNNGRFISHDNMLFILTPWIEGEKCSFDNNNHVSLSIKTLANIHSVSKNFYPINNNSSKIGFDDYYISTLKHFQDLLKSSNDAFKYKDSFSKNFLDNFDVNIKLAKISLYMSRNIDKELLSTALCHGDYVNKNIIFTDSNNVWIIDFDKCKEDYCARDLSYFMRRILKRENTNWDSDLAISILKDYTSIKSLSSSDLKYIVSYICFPQKYWKISRDYYRNIKRCNKLAFKRLLSTATLKSKNQYKFALEVINKVENEFNISLI